VTYDDAQDAVAAEYVLGTLSADEREHAEALRAIDPGFAEAVRIWERRLGELNVMVEAVEPPSQLWDKIRDQIGNVAPGTVIPPSEAAAAPTPQPEMPSSTAKSLSEVAAIASSLLPPSAEKPQVQATDPLSVLLSPQPAEPSPAPPIAEPKPVAEAKHVVQPRSAPALSEPRIERSADVIYLARRVSHWRRMTAAFGTIAALLAIFVAVTLFAPGLSPLGRFSSAQFGPQAPTPLGARLVAVLQHDPTSPAFLLTIDPQSGTLIVRRVTAAAGSGRSYQLWLISSRFPTPRSLGVVGADEFTQSAIPSGVDVDTMRAASYAVSLEPAGGSPSGAPTGPILFTGKMVDSLPASATIPHT
jgi:anti-sigma-K factor RskA